MAQLSPETVWNAKEQQLLSLLETDILNPKPRKIHFYAPSFMPYQTSSYRSKPDQFPTISITGKTCTLNCKHCEGKVLATMHSATTPEELFALSLKLKQKGTSGYLISGGCMPNGSVPLQQFIPTIKKIKNEIGSAVIVHTGIIDATTAQALKNAEVDAALIDIIGSNETIKCIYNLNVTVQDYANSLKALQEAHLNVVPHIIVGLHNGQLKGELQALKIIARHKPSALVIIAFTPIRGTAMALAKPPQPIEIARIAATARRMFPETPIALGCMRPKGKHRAETDVLCLKAGVNAIAFPSEEAIQYAESKEYESSFSAYCCSQIYTGKKASNLFRSNSK
ncbi:MAG: radical SAM protein [Candidatus Bathyarchaeota archaeon]|nr:radical SAM protein [Candidatus Bathyarchaeota archaeon]